MEDCTPGLGAECWRGSVSDGNTKFSIVFPPYLSYARARGRRSFHITSTGQDIMKILLILGPRNCKNDFPSCSSGNSSLGLDRLVGTVRKGSTSDDRTTTSTETFEPCWSFIIDWENQLLLMSMMMMMMMSIEITLAVFSLIKEFVRCPLSPV